MSDIRAVGTPVTYSDDNPITKWMDKLSAGRGDQRRQPKDQAERELLGRWLAYRGRDELESIVGSAAYAYSHFEMTPEFRYHLADHIGTEAGHGWGYIRQGDQVDPTRDHTLPDPEFEPEFNVLPRSDHLAMQRRDLLSFIIAGNLWPYGTATSATIQSILVTTPRVVDFEENVVQAEERGHHSAILQVIHDYVWKLIEQNGEQNVRRRIGEIDAEALNSRSRTIFDPGRREFLRKYFNTTFENVAKFYAWREYLYLNVLGFPPEPLFIKNWPAEVPQPQLAYA